jgi:hypothetical protein
MRSLFFAALTTAAIIPIAAVSAQSGDSAQPSITLYELPAYLGRTVTITASTPDLKSAGFANRAQSARVTGKWQVCPAVNFAGSCRILNADAPVLRRATVTSIRPVVDATTSSSSAGTNSTGSGSGNSKLNLDDFDVSAGVEGQDVAFFARPTIGNSDVSAGTNDRAAADAFCKRAGYAGSLNAGRARTQTSNLIDVSAASRARGYALRDVLCRR